MTFTVNKHKMDDTKS